jgi:16S rRNA (uracil1498-N3)-methyltransferase
MNSLLLFIDEFVSPNHVVIKGGRAKEVMDSHGLKVGLDIAASCLNGKRGRAQVHTCSSDRIELEVVLHKEPPIRDNTSILIAIPRPQTIKKVIQTVACYGAQELHFVSSQACQASYRQSKSLNREMLDKETFLGLQQAFDCIAPKIFIHDNLSDGLRALSVENSQNKNTLMLCAHTYNFESQHAHMHRLANVKLHHVNDKIIMALGPEAGWTNNEVSIFQNEGYRLISLGERIYRVETALALLLGQILFLREKAINENK